jgi:ABC-type multidrug transport system fused ATPase/permease subunit
VIWRYVTMLGEVLRLSWRHYPRATAGLLAVTALSAGTGAAAALALRQAIDGIIRGDRSAAVLGAADAAVVFAAQMYLGDVRRVLDAMLIDGVGALHLRPLIERRLAELPGLDHLERSDLLDRVTLLRGFGWRLSVSMWTAVAAVFDVAKLGLLLALLGTAVSPWLLLLVVFAAAPIWFDQRGQREVSQAELDTAEAFRLQRHLFNLATGPAGGKEIRVAGSGDEVARRQREAWAEAMHVRYRARLRATMWKLAGWTVFTLGFGAGLTLVVYQAAYGTGTVGDVVLAITVAVTLRGSLENVLFDMAYAIGGRTLAEPYLWLRDYAAAADHRGDVPAPIALRDGITLDNVSFTYPGTPQRALNGVSCHLPAGSVVAIVGEYGSGKTTLVKLLGKFYQPDEGRILVDATDLADLTTGDWRARSSAVFQDFGRFHTRLGDAIGIGELAHLDDGHVMAAVRAADAERMVEHLPKGLDTQLGRRFDGVDLSEGQWQKTALARAAMRTEPLLFMLDEPTASLDAPSEHAIFVRSMAGARRYARRTGAITVIISHRFSTVTGADHILVLDQGRLVEQGSHQELLAADGTYAELYRIQATAYASA